jgi:hypothetical protein
MAPPATTSVTVLLILHMYLCDRDELTCISDVLQEWRRVGLSQTGGYVAWHAVTCCAVLL